MEIPCKDIAQVIEQTLSKEVSALIEKGKTPKLATILLGDAAEQHSYVKIKERVAKRLGIGFEFIHLPKIPPFEEFLSLIAEKSADPSITGIIIQQPLPHGYDTSIIYSKISYVKEIEGHKRGSVFQFPLSLSVLTGLKYILNGNILDERLLVSFPEDDHFFQELLKGKKIVIAGRGVTGGKPIAQSLEYLGIKPNIIHSKTKNPDALYKQADIIITATGKKILSANMITPGTALLNVGLREERGFLKGDYDEKDVEDIASYYTKTPGGLGPIDVLYLYKNLIDATLMQIEKHPQQ